MRKADTISGIAVSAVALFFGIMAARMPWYDSEWGVAAAPGLVPLILASCLLLCGLFLIIRARIGVTHYKRMEAMLAAASAHDDDDSAAETPEASSEGRPLTELQRVALTVGLSIAYILLLGRIPYAVATALYIFVFISIFQGKNYLKAAIIAVISSAVVWFSFAKIFFVFLP